MADCYGVTRHKEKGESGQVEDQSQRSVKAEGVDQGMRVLSYLISGVLVYGLLGWLGDRLFNTGFLLPVGIVLGAAFGVYVIVRRFGQLSAASPSGKPPTTGTDAAEKREEPR
jgi:ATP synthase protein I